MEKFAVDETLQNNNSLDKEASEPGKCPDCGADCEKHGRVILCPNCGSAPFEGEKK